VYLHEVIRTRISMQYARTFVRVPVSSIAFATSLHYISSFSHETSRTKQAAAKYNVPLAKIHNYIYVINSNYYSKIVFDVEPSEAIKLKKLISPLNGTLMNGNCMCFHLKQNWFHSITIIFSIKRNYSWNIKYIFSNVIT